MPNHPFMNGLWTLNKTIREVYILKVMYRKEDSWEISKFLEKLENKTNEL